MRSMLSVLAVLLKSLIVIAVAILMIASVLLWGKLMHLLWAGSELVGTAVSSLHCDLISKDESMEWNNTHFVQEAVECTRDQRFHIVG